MSLQVLIGLFSPETVHNHQSKHNLHSLPVHLSYIFSDCINPLSGNYTKVNNRYNVISCLTYNISSVFILCDPTSQGSL